MLLSRLEDHYKGHDAMQRALPVIRRAVPDVRWVLIGDGCLRPELEMAVRQAGLDEIVSFSAGWTTRRAMRGLSERRCS